MKRKINLIALDLDGTFMNDKKQITEENCRVVREAVQAGVTVVISTGRPYSGLPVETLTQIGIEYAITANGAAIYRLPGRNGMLENACIPDDGCLSERECIYSLEEEVTPDNESLSERVCIYSDGMDCTFAVEMVAQASARDIQADAFIEGQGYCQQYFYDRIERLAFSEKMKEYIRTTRKTVENLAEFIKLCGKPVEKVSMSFYRDDQGIWQGYDWALDKYGKDDSLHAVSGGFHNLEISKGSATKGNGLRILAGMLGIGMNETMACGDSQNDMDILEAAAVGVAMGNADEEVKQIADYVTKSNEEDGVAYAIRKLIL